MHRQGSLHEDEANTPFSGTLGSGCAPPGASRWLLLGNCVAVLENLAAPWLEFGQRQLQYCIAKKDQGLVTTTRAETDRKSKDTEAPDGWPKREEEEREGKGMR